MNKKITDEKMGISYTLRGDYYLPDLVAPTERKIGIWGQRRRNYLRDYHSGIYTGLLLSGKLDAHLAEIDAQAAHMYSLLVEQLAKQEKIAEQLKKENQIEWVARMNNIHNRATEIVGADLIYT